MKKENFICPCCGLPNHLEFEYIKDYERVKETEEGSEQHFTGNFKNFSIDEENRIEVGQELFKRYAEIKNISNKYGVNNNFNEWFDQNVVCFILKDGTKYVWLGYNNYLLNITNSIPTQENLTEISNLILTQENLTSIELDKTFNTTDYSDITEWRSYTWNPFEIENHTVVVYDDGTTKIEWEEQSISPSVIINEGVIVHGE